MSFTLPQAIARVVEGEHLSESQMEEVMNQIMTGQATAAQIGGFLVAMRMKGETVEEITAAVKVMRKLASPVAFDYPGLIDTCGTGGDGARLFNVSTASALVVSAAGGKVAKHGNRSASSSSGSADLLEEAGVAINLTGDQVARCIDQVGLGFMFAQTHHSAMKYAIGPRKEMQIRTLFNMLGPMTNPAGAKHQVIGLYSASIAPLFAEVLKRLGSKHVLLVHSDDGLDELSISSSSQVVELNQGQISQYRLNPADFQLYHANLDGLQVDNAAESLSLIQSALEMDASESSMKARDMIIFNSAAALYAADICASLTEAVELARDVISTGQARQKLDDLISFTQTMAGQS